LHAQDLTAKTNSGEIRAAGDVSLAAARRGDIVTINGIKAIVFQTYGDGHGKAMYVKALRGKKNAWCKSVTGAKLRTTDKESGRANTEAVFRFISENGLKIDDFPAAAWCKSLGAGWYIPSIKELEAFINWWLGNEVELNWDDEIEDETQGPDISETQFSKQINHKIMDAGGIPFLNGVFVSTENSRGKLSAFKYIPSKGYWKFGTVSKTGVGKWYMGRAFFEY